MSTALRIHSVSDQRSLTRLRFSKLGCALAKARLKLLIQGWKLFCCLPRVGRRLWNLVGTIPLLFLLLPIAVLIPLFRRSAGLKFQTVVKVGRWGNRFGEFKFDSSNPTVAGWLRRFQVQRLPAVINVLKGDMSLVGPRALEPENVDLAQALDRKRSQIRPGLVSLWGLRQRTGIDFESEFETDGEYIETRTVLGDLGIMVRSLLAGLYGGHSQGSDSPRILGIRIDNLSMNEAVKIIRKMLVEEGGHQVCFVNPHCANLASEDQKYSSILKDADLNLADGIGMRLAGQLLGSPIGHNVNGTDLFPRICANLEGSSHGIYLLGGRPGRARLVADWIRHHHPSLKVCGFQHGYFQSSETDEVVRHIAVSGAHLLLVAMGVPGQEKWIFKHLDATQVRVAMGVGGLFDFYSGTVDRAPQWLREMGLEWLFRLYQEPARMWKRYIVGNCLFIFRVLTSRIDNQNPAGGT